MFQCQIFPYSLDLRKKIETEITFGTIFFKLFQFLTFLICQHNQKFSYWKTFPFKFIFLSFARLLRRFLVRQRTASDMATKNSIEPTSDVINVHRYDSTQFSLFFKQRFKKNFRRKFIYWVDSLVGRSHVKNFSR